MKTDVLNEIGESGHPANETEEQDEEDALALPPQVPAILTGGAGTDILVVDPPWMRREGTVFEDSAGVDRIDRPELQDSVLLLWSTAQHLADAVSVTSRLGYDYQTNGIWDRGTNGSGRWFRAGVDLLLVGTKGEVATPDLTKSAPAVASRCIKHGSKDDWVRTLIQSWCPATRLWTLDDQGQPYPLEAHLKASSAA